MNKKIIIISLFSLWLIIFLVFFRKDNSLLKSNDQIIRNSFEKYSDNLYLTKKKKKKKSKINKSPQKSSCFWKIVGIIIILVIIFCCGCYVFYLHWWNVLLSRKCIINYEEGKVSIYFSQNKPDQEKLYENLSADTRLPNNQNSDDLVAIQKDFLKYATEFFQLFDGHFLKAVYEEEKVNHFTIDGWFEAIDNYVNIDTFPKEDKDLVIGSTALDIGCHTVGELIIQKDGKLRDLREVFIKAVTGEVIFYYEDTEKKKNFLFEGYHYLFHLIKKVADDELCFFFKANKNYPEYKTKFRLIYNNLSKLFNLPSKKNNL